MAYFRTLPEYPLNDRVLTAKVLSAIQRIAAGATSGGIEDVEDVVASIKSNVLRTHPQAVYDYIISLTRPILETSKEFRDSLLNFRVNEDNATLFYDRGQVDLAQFIIGLSLILSPEGRNRNLTLRVASTKLDDLDLLNEVLEDREDIVIDRVSTTEPNWTLVTADTYAVMRHKVSRDDLITLLGRYAMFERVVVELTESILDVNLGKVIDLIEPKKGSRVEDRSLLATGSYPITEIDFTIKGM